MSPAPQRTKPVFVPSSGMPQAQPPSRAIYASMGKLAIFEMLRQLYLELEKSTIRGLFPEDMVAASERSAAFFVQLLGGPPLFTEQFGPPRMRARHVPFEIDGQAREIWLDCFRRVLRSPEQNQGFPQDQLAGFEAFLEAFSAWMVNVAPEQ